MDKNFVNIDDLVRQRLSGGEETERAGAWLQMRDLLDEEMPRDKAGFIFWRRLFSAIVVLVLISSISIGGYMYTASRGGDGNNTANNNANNNAANSDLTISVASNQVSTNEVSNSKQISTAVVSARMNITDNEHVNKQNSEKVKPIVKQTNKQILASNTTTLNENATTLNNAVAVNNTKHNNKEHNSEARNPQFIAQLIAANERSKKQAKSAMPIIAGANNTTGNATASAVSRRAAKANNQGRVNTSKANNSVATAGRPAHKNRSNRSAYRKETTNNTALASNTKSAAPASSNPSSATHNPVTGTVNSIRSSAAIRNSNVNIGKLALSSNTPATKSIKGVSAVNPINDNNKWNKSSGNSAAAMTASSMAATNKNNRASSKEAAEAEMDKKTIERLHLSEHLVSTSTGESYYKLDTISIETVNEQLGLNAQSKREDPLTGGRSISASTPSTSAGTPAASSINGSNTPNTFVANNPNTSGANNMQSNTGAQSNANATILPGATASATGMSSMGVKENQATKMAGSATTAEKLSATFNDIKFHVASAQFAPGLTAGINGTFFGPASFKGFQFGVTGNFIFGDNFSILTELKYFERINNNYSINDNYYSYTPAGGGQYNKVLNPLSYSFSTLHSIELPVSIRYCKSHFNFYVGGNIVYTFAINTGASTPTVNTNAPVLVSAQGNDNAPKISANDFDSRFGLGYLIGISYQVSHNVTLDVRNVQTVWNNASTQGAKIISNQLYKSPSLQVSIGYRLGGRDKNKDQ